MTKTQKNIDKIEERETAQAGRPVKKQEEMLVRIMQTDIPSSKNIYIGLTKIKGVSFAMSNVLCHLLNLEKTQKISELSVEEIKKIELGIKNAEVLEFLKNRRNDFNTGESKHLTVTELDLRKEFDIKRLRKIRCYKGSRHAKGLPVRGQRTKSHFRKKGKHKVVGVKSKSSGRKG